MKKNMETIKKEIKNITMSFTGVDIYMIEAGYYSVLDDGAVDDIKVDDIKTDKQIVYTACDTNECEIVIFFEITIDCGEDDESYFFMKVTDVQEF